MGPNRRSTPKPPNAFFIGGLIGAGVGYLSSLFLARQEGEETQRELRQKAQEVSYKALSELEIQLDNLQGKLSGNKSSEIGKPSRIEVDVKERYEGGRREPTVELEVHPVEDEV